MKKWFQEVVRQRARILQGGLCLALLSAILAVPQPLVTLGPQQHAQSVNPKLGVHTRLSDEVEPWKIKHTLEMVREMGASWIGEYFPWAYYQPDAERFDWTHADLVIDHAQRQGLTVVARLGFVPAWARPKETTFLYLDPQNYSLFARYAAAFAARYKGRVRYMQIWNEPNLALEWGYRPINPGEYVQMLRVVYAAVKAANPDMQIVAGALAPTLAPPGDPNGLNDLAYLQGMYDAGAGPYFDLLAIHAYGWTFPPDDPPAADTVNFQRAELLHDVMVRNGDAAKHALITEGGWNDYPRWTRAVRPAQRVQYTLQAYQMAQSQWPWLDAAILWAFRYPAPMHTYQDYYTFVDPDFVPKPIYLEVQRYAHGG